MEKQIKAYLIPKDGTTPVPVDLEKFEPVIVIEVMESQTFRCGVNEFGGPGYRVVEPVVTA